MGRAMVLALTGILLIGLAGGGKSAGGPAPGNDADRFKNLPKGWTLKASGVIPERQLPTYTRKLGGQIVRISNTTLTVDGQQLDVNTITCKTDEDAANVQKSLLRVHDGIHAACPKGGRSVVEFVGNMRLIERVYQELGFKPPRVTWEVSFHAAPVEKGDYMMWNKLCGAFFVPNPNEAMTRELAKSFTFGDQIRLRNHGLGNEKSSFVFTPPPRESKLDAEGDMTTYSFADLPREHGFPKVGVVVTVTAEAYAMTPSKRKAGQELLGPNEFWPSTDPEIVALAKEITAGKTNARDKVAALLEWHMVGKNIRYAGPMGTRYGVKKVLDQRFGRCWDFSDCFVTLCRASGVPSRQVLGWLHGESGHFWAEVLLEGEGWRQVDPTAGMGCDCRYIPYVATENGKTPLVYTSLPRIREITATEKRERP